MQTNKRRRQSEPPTILPRIESLPAPPPDYPGSESPEYLSFKGANHCTAANSANTSFCTLSSHSSEGRGRLPSEYCIPNKSY
uniref:Uncharacterized protein n=1 Tax=Panagrolaimus sp. PS1159 TaxID=55785 RepID=A0AC35F3J8_9BILA